MIPGRLRRLASACLLGIAAGCGRRSGVVAGDAARAEWLAGLWDSRFELNVSLAERADTAPAVEGRIAMLPNRWLDASYESLGVPTDYGVYDVDFSPLGIEPRAHGETPTVVASWLGTDSVRVALTAGTPSLTITLSGRASGDSVAGTWSYAVARAAGGGGRFVMRRAGTHARAVRQSGAPDRRSR